MKQIDLWLALFGTWKQSLLTGVKVAAAATQQVQGVRYFNQLLAAANRRSTALGDIIDSSDVRLCDIAFGECESAHRACSTLYCTSASQDHSAPQTSSASESTPKSSPAPRIKRAVLALSDTGLGAGRGFVNGLEVESTEHRLRANYSFFGGVS